MSVESEARFNSVMVAICDINGSYRGKRLPFSQIDKVFSGSLRMPLSASTVDIWGRDIEGSELVFESGDGDGVCRPLRDEIVPSPWLGEGSGFLPLCLYEESGEPHAGDPRNALSAVVARYAEKGLRPVVATELEFYLADISEDADSLTEGVAVPKFAAENVLSVQDLEEMGPFLDDVYAACEVCGIRADAAISETGVGQFEINLLHTDDPVRAADDALMFKRIVKGCARAHGRSATFMAKPHGESAGSGLHVHFSLLNEAGENVFDDGTDEGSDVMLSAVAGLTTAMPESTLLFAPHLNSYRRLRPETHAPTLVAWGYENRTAAIRIPGGSNKARRIEHRVSGADANPYLVLTAILGAALEGIEANLKPPAPLVGNAYNSDLPDIPSDWSLAINAFEEGEVMKKIFDPMLLQLIVQAKRQEMQRFLETVTEFEYQTYLEVV
ncbi:glutamine synthetase family protein [Falsihalocynthiibacter sp. SS001]|uniref:glutamine synthetase family protein n=1 Tax=Falsihalocynthiibacter sp. SS001 TaxID=3349698 RepID=UPI0036D29788